MLKVCVVTPVHNDWQCFDELVRRMEVAELSKLCHLEILVVNDGSTDIDERPVSLVPEVEVKQMNLAMNVGHQRAIIVGLCHLVSSGHDHDFVVVMDADGEDEPDDVVRLLDVARSAAVPAIVFAERTKRSEGRLFTLYYRAYRIVFRVLTGRGIKFGNFSCLAADLLPRIVNDEGFWNHYSAAALRSRIPFTSVATVRGIRYFGRSKMNTDGLILHGFSALSVYMDVIVLRLFKLAAIAMTLCIAAVGVLVCIRLFTDLAIPGWTSFLVAIVFNILITLMVFISMVLLQHLNNRRMRPARPIEFCTGLVASVESRYRAK